MRPFSAAIFSYPRDIPPQVNRLETGVQMSQVLLLRMLQDTSAIQLPTLQKKGKERGRGLWRAPVETGGARHV